MRKSIIIRFIVPVTLLFLVNQWLFAGADERTTGVHDGNLVITRYSNYGNLGHRDSGPQMEWPKGTGFVYGFEFIMMAGAEVLDVNDDTVHIVSESYSHPTSGDISPDGTHWYSWQPLPGYYNMGSENKLLYPAMSHKPETWPASWPHDYPGEPGTRDGLWNGEFGAYTRADQESYYVMDDRDNDEYEYYPFIGSPVDSSGYPYGRRGLGFEVKVRGYQWAAVEAEDILIVRYDIANISHKDLETVVFGMYVDAMVGGTNDNPDHATFDDLDDITYCWDHDGVDNRGRTGLGFFGFAFLESPGDPLNGIDDDQDGLIDERQDNPRGNYIFGPVGKFGEPKWHWEGDEDGDWRIYEDDNGNGVWDYGEQIMDDVGSDGVGPYDQDYIAPDIDRTEGNGVPDDGEPNYNKTDNDESDQIGLTSSALCEAQSMAPDERTWNHMKPGLFAWVQPANLAFVYGSGYFKVMRGETRKFAIACLFGIDEDDIYRNKRTMQRIYDADYSFTKPPLKPRLTAVAGDGKVILSWDKAAERSIDPIYKEDFEGYLVYRSTDPSFNDIKTVTDAYGAPIYWKPIAQFDLVDGLKGPHPIAIEGTGAQFYMGKDTGLKYYYVDENVQNGRTYYYAVCSYDKGYDTDFYEKGFSRYDLLAPVAPSECSKIIQTDLVGNVTSVDRNCAVVVPNAPSAGYVPGEVENIEHIGIATGEYAVNVIVSDSVQDGHTYTITFVDDSTDWRNTERIKIQNITTGRILYENDYNEFEVSNEIFEGLQFEFDNDSTYIKEYGWKVGNCNLPVEVDTAWGVKIIRVPEDLEIRVLQPNADTTYNPLAWERYPVNFQVWSTTRNEQMDFMFSEPINKDSMLNAGDKVYPVINAKGFNYNDMWEIYFRHDTTQKDVILPQPGDIFEIKVYKPFNSDDTLRFTTAGSFISQTRAKSSLDDVYVVPDPYVVTASWEKPLFYASGRGERRVDFINLPQECTIRIFTMSGKRVRTLHHSAMLTDDGTESWDLLTDDGLTVAFGVYIFHVEAPGIGSKIGKFAIIK